MAKKRRTVLMKKGRQSVKLVHGGGHIWETDASGTLGHPLHDPAKERAMFARMLGRYRKRGYAMVSDTAAEEAKDGTSGATRPSGMSPAAWRWIQGTDKILSDWKDDQYDNFKDAIEQASDMLHRAPPGQTARVDKLEKLAATVLRQLREEGAGGAEIAEYRSWLPSKKGRAAKRPVKRTKKRSLAKRRATNATRL
jgi:hypothetical protein